MFLGGKELIMFEGVVEDRNDPLLIGRVRVRVYGFHDQDKQAMPTNTLPWATPLLPPDEGRNVVGYKEKDTVMGFFRDGEAKQFPVILGKIAGIPEDPSNPEVGYDDPTADEDLVPGKVARPPEMIPPPTLEAAEEGELPPTGKYDNPDKLPVESIATGQLASEYGIEPFPFDVNGDGQYNSVDASLLIDPDQDGIIEEELEDITEVQQVPISRYPLEDRLKESDASRLARNEMINQTLVARKKGTLQTTATATHTALGVGTDQAAPSEALGEPETPYAVVYPFNHVYESESGHVIEYDDTPGVERLHFYHRAGTFREIHPDGKQVDKAVNDRFDLSLGTANYIAAKDVNITGKENVRVLAGDVMNLESGADMNQDSGGDRNVLVGGNANTRIKENTYIVIEGDVRVLVKGDVNFAVEGDMKVKVEGDFLLDAANTRITAKGQNVLAAGQAVVTSGPLTFFNTALTDGLLVHSTISDTALVAATIDLVLPLPHVIAPVMFEKENDADNKDNLITSSTPKEGYLFNENSMIAGGLTSQDLYKPESDSDGNAVVLSLSPAPAKLYHALPTGETEAVTLEYKHKEGNITTWESVRPKLRKGSLIEVGTFRGIANGGRAHWRFTKPGAEYPPQMVLQIGGTEYLLVESITRHEAL